MGYSKLISGIVPASTSNYTKGRNGYRICKFTPHHMAGVLTGEQCGHIFQRAGRSASSNYGIGNDGRIYGYVDENDRAWTSSNRANDCQAITVEVSNCEIGGQWKISDAAWNSLVNLAVDVCKRYKFRLIYDGTPNGSLTRHNMFTSTSCPGPYLQSRFAELAETVNRILDGNVPKPTPVPEPTTKHSIGDVVTINGVYTSSNSTKKLNPARDTGTITRIIAGALNPYLLDNGNLGWVNDNVIISNQQPTLAPEPTPARKTANELADEIIAGKWGNGSTRFDNLRNAGYSEEEIDAAQNEVNRRYGVGGGSKPVSGPITNGSKVIVKQSAGRYVTGQTIPSWVKGKTYTVMQKGDKKSLLKEIMSWVYDSDLEKQ